MAHRQMLPKFMDSFSLWVKNQIYFFDYIYYIGLRLKFLGFGLVRIFC